VYGIVGFNVPLDTL